MNIFVGNLSFGCTEADVKKLFEGFGNVVSAVIVMRKEKKAPKSRGFGFVQMPDEQQALAAIAALNGKEFMERVLDVNPARPKVEVERVVELKEKRQPKVTVEAQQHPREEREQKKTWFNPVFNKPGTYKGGRRTRSYMKRRGLAGMQEEAKPRRRSQDNPMRWRKRGDKPRPWQKSPGEHKPWEKVEVGARPWKKTEGESKPWRKSEGGIKPWKKPAGDAKPWSKSNGRPQKSRFKGRRKPGGYKR
jgi:RNA recognition motif-containing protein